MPRLLLLRHAKAERARPGEHDHDRVLSKRGRKDSEAVGQLIAERNERPDLVLCSTSVRTRETWSRARPALAGTPEPRFLRAIYEGDDYVSILRAEGGDAPIVLLIGHNPAMHATAVTLAADVSGRDGAELTSNFPTAALAVLDFDGEWKKLAAQRMRLVAFLKPGT